MIINELLEKEKMSKYRLSKESGVAMTTITDICSGKADINKCAAGTLHKIAKVLGFKRILCVCDEDNIASEKIIIKNGGLFENKLYDDLEKVFIKRFWINL